jgi:hypothetical protein
MAITGNRQLTDSFINDLKDAQGLLHPILERVKQDNTLMLSIRDNYVNIYYRGGNIIRLTRRNTGIYDAFFDKRYIKNDFILPHLPPAIQRTEDVKAWIDALPKLKQAMDIYFSNVNKLEREFQQLIARENNCSSISGETEYFITDIEFSDSDARARFDLLAIRWTASERKNSRNCKPVLIEMKYGDNALGGNAGLLKHLQDIDLLVADTERYGSLLKTMTSQFSQLDALELLKFNHPAGGCKINLTTESKPEVIFVLANHNPRSPKLKDILDDPGFIEYAHSLRFDLKFFVAKFAGYGFHTECMLPLSDFRRLLDKGIA